MQEPVSGFAAVWEYEVRAEQAAAFVETYGPAGGWSQLFGRSAGYRGTTLLRDAARPGRFITIDRWDSAAAFETFQQDYGAEYARLDELCSRLTVREQWIGHFAIVDRE